MREKPATVLFVIILSFIAVISVQVFNKLLKVDSTFVSSGTAAFLGAFFAFLFMRIGDFFKSYSDRISKNHNALVRLEYLLNTLLSTLDDNVHNIEIFDQIYTRYTNSKDPSQVFVWVNRLHPAVLYDDLLLKLINIDLINELFTLNVRLRKLNDSMETINGAYVESKDAFMNTKMDRDNYLLNLKWTYTNLIDIEKFLSDTIEEVMRALSAIRVLSKVRPIMIYVIRRLAVHKYSRKFEAQRDSEILKLRAEIEQVKKTSKKRIESILKEKRDS